MYEIHSSSWPFATNASDPRDHFHLTALREARVVTDRKPELIVAPARRGVIERLRLAFAPGAVVSSEPCTCPA